MGDNYYYAWVRKDLSMVQQIIQVGHACFEIGNRTGIKTPEVSSMVLFEVADESELVKIATKLSKQIPEKYFIMYEPDYDTGYTAICTRAFSGEDRTIFGGYSLYQADNEDEETKERRTHVHVTEAGSNE